MAENDYFVRYRGRVTGPFSPDALARLVRLGTVSRVHELSLDQVTWRQAGSVEELFSRSGAERTVTAPHKAAPADTSPPDHAAHSSTGEQAPSSSQNKSAEGYFECAGCGGLFADRRYYFVNGDKICEACHQKGFQGGAAASIKGEPSYSGSAITGFIVACLGVILSPVAIAIAYFRTPHTSFYHLHPMLATGFTFGAFGFLLTMPAISFCLKPVLKTRKSVPGTGRGLAVAGMAIGLACLLGWLLLTAAMLENQDRRLAKEHLLAPAPAKPAGPTTHPDIAPNPRIELGAATPKNLPNKTSPRLSSARPASVPAKAPATNTATQ